MESLLNLLQREQDIANHYNENQRKINLLKGDISKLKIKCDAIPSEELNHELTQKSQEASNLHFINCNLIKENEEVRKKMALYISGMKDWLLD